jgi:D-amino peptidase
VVLVTGDGAVVRETAQLLGDIETVAVKEGITRTSARCLSPSVAAERIRQAARRAAKARGRVFAVTAPVTLRVVLHRAGHADMATLIPAIRRVDGRTVEWTGEDMKTAYQVYRAIATLAAAV